MVRAKTGPLSKRKINSRQAREPKKFKNRGSSIVNIRKTSRKTASAKVQKEILAAPEMQVERTKFFHPETVDLKLTKKSELPLRYGKDLIVLQVRDPYWIHAYWELSEATINRLKSELGNKFYQARRSLRVYDISNIIFSGNNAHNFFDIEINEFADNWYIDTAGPGRSWCADLGLKFPDGSFITIVRSNIVSTPLDGPSRVSDEEWMIPDEEFDILYGTCSGFIGSSPMGRPWQKKIKRAGRLIDLSSRRK